MMTLMIHTALGALIITYLCAQSAAAQDPPAPFKELEGKLRKARTVQAVITGVRTVEIHQAGVKTATNVIELRTEFFSEMDGKSRIVHQFGAVNDASPDKLEVVNDGAALRAFYKGQQAPSPPEWTRQEIPSGWRDAILRYLAVGRASAIVVPSFSSVNKPRDGPNEFNGAALRFKMSVDKAGPPAAERAGERDAQVIAYDWTDAMAAREIKVTANVWTDTKTGLPFKRSHRYSLDVENLRLEVSEEESLESFRLDDPIDAGVFVVPKGK